MRKLAQELDVGRRVAVLARARQGGAARPAARPHRGRERGARPRSGELARADQGAGRENRRLLQSHRDAAQISLGRDPGRPALDAGARAQPRPPRRRRAAAARARPRRGHVRALRRRLRVRGEHATAASRPTRSSSPSTSARCRPTSSRRCTRSPTTWSPAIATSASSSRSSCSCAGSRRWPTTTRRGPCRPARARGASVLSRSPSPIPRSTSGAFVNCTSPYSTISNSLPHGSAKRSPRPRCGLIPASFNARRTASRSSTTSPKWRSSSGPWRRPSATARNWSPMSMNAIPRTRPRSSNSNSRP